MTEFENHLKKIIEKAAINKQKVDIPFSLFFKKVVCRKIVDTSFNVIF